MTSLSEIRSVENVMREFDTMPMLVGSNGNRNVIHSFLRISITALLKHAQSEIEKGKKTAIPPSQTREPVTQGLMRYDREIGCNSAKEEDIGILEAMIRGV